MATINTGYVRAKAYLFGVNIAAGTTIPAGVPEYEVMYKFSPTYAEQVLGAPALIMAVIRVPVGLSDSGIRSRFYRLRLASRNSRRWGSTPKGTFGRLP